MKYLLYNCFLILTILTFAYINSLPTKKTEPFTPEIRGFYRPIIRRTRIAAEGFYERTNKSVNDSFESLYKNLGLK